MAFRERPVYPVIQERSLMTRNATRRTPRCTLAAVTCVAAVGVLALAACASGGAGSSGSDRAAAVGKLAGICPSTVKIQTGWYPEAEKGGVYQLVGPDGTVDANTGAYSRQIGGVTVSILAGGPYLGNQSTIARMYQDPSILLGEVNTDDAIKSSANQPVVAVVAPLQKSPLGIIYDPSIYHFTSIADVGKSGATVLKAGEDASSDLLVASGAIKKSQLDFSYDGTPARFIASGGRDVFIEYATEVPYEYQHSISQWGKPLKSILLADGGYTSYENSLSVTPENETKYHACLKALVPMIQQAIVNYAANPGPVNAALIKYSQEVKSPTVLSQGLNDYTNQVMKSDGILVNGTAGMAGSFDIARVTGLISHMRTVAKNQHITLKAGLSANDLVTNQFLDPSIKIAK
jgi:hypothetical protein